MDARECLCQGQTIGRGDEIVRIRGCLRVRSGRVRQAKRARCSFEEERHRHLKDLRYVLQATLADTIGSIFIFLNLLERQSKRVPEFGSYRA
jgi:hypothetical protein